MSKKKLTLRDWIDHQGIDQVAKKLKATRATVRHWRRGYCLPKSDQMLKIKKLSRGRLTIDSMVEAHFSK